MKTSLNTILLSTLLSFQLFAQSPPNSYFTSTSTVPCYFDTTQTIVEYDDWMVYQTLNDIWDGPFDSTKCIGLIPNGNGYKIDLNQIDAEKPFFIKSLMDDNTKVWLQKDWLHTLQAIMNMPADAPINLSTNCANGLCSGIIAGVEVPNADNTGTNLRIHPVSFQDFSACDANTCLPTERFEDNYLKEFVFKITFDSTDISDLVVSPASVYLEPAWYVGYLQETVIASPANYEPADSTYYLHFYDLPNIGWDAALVLYSDTTYPSSSDISYIDVTVEPNLPEPQNINLTIDDWNNLIFQPFTSLRGGLVEGSDSIRHSFNLINDGGNLCMTFIEVSFGPNEKFIHKKGNVDFGHPYACMQFMEGSKLIVEDNATFHYGDNGMGILALRQGSTIDLGKNSTLVINNTLNMFEAKTNISHQIYMNLNAGSSLIFGEHAHLTNQYSIDKAMKLNIYMNGGVLDDRNLSADERALINKIYPETQLEGKDSAFLFPNPADTYTYWTYHSQNDAEVTIQLYDLSGRLLQTGKHELSTGPNQIAIDLRSFPEAIYYLHWQTEGESGVKKILVH